MNNQISIKNMKREVMIELIRNYYKEQGRIKYPNMENYTTAELKKVIRLFEIK